MHRFIHTSFLLLACHLTQPIWAQEKKDSKSTPSKPRPIARLLWQDDADQTLKWSDVIRGSNGLTLSAQTVANFPKLDAEQQSFVQMEPTAGVVVVGIHDKDDGKFQSGWVAVTSGVVEEEHGDHSHWHFEKPPAVVLSQLDQQQGNPAHVYHYDGDIFLANDKNNGFTLLRAAALNSATSATAPAEVSRFFSGGGGHITLAAVNGKVCYSTWVDRDGDNQGRVDVIPIDGDSIRKGYQLKLPSGGLHGATANSGRVFFAPSDGICWLDADLDLKLRPEEVQIRHISLGVDSKSGKPMRTGAFTNHNQYVLFMTGAADQATLCIVDAKATEPSVLKMAMPIAEGLAWTTPACVKTPAGKNYALLFSDRRSSEAEETLAVVDLDPNADGNLSDARVAKTIAVGPSRVVGHGGHHEVSFSASGRLAFITNPGDGSIWILSLKDLNVESKHQVSGTPSRIVAMGG
jgi:hypothetical protein